MDADHARRGGRHESTERSALATRAERLLEGSGRTLREPRPEQSAPLSLAHGRLWDATVDLAAPLFRADSAVADAVFDDLATAALLTAFPLTEERSRARRSRALPATMRRAMEYVDAHLADPLTVILLADAARVSARTVQEGFRRHLGTTPHAYIRDARLRAARLALRDAAPGDSTIAEIAGRFGLAHPSRFARDYFRAFGEYPSDTLRR